MSACKDQIQGLIQAHKNLMNEYSLSAVHNYEFKPGYFVDIVFFKGDKLLVALNYFESVSGTLPENYEFNPGANKDLSGPFFDYWALYDGHYFHLMQVNVLIGFTEHIIPFKTFLFRIAQDDVHGDFKA